jgi:hypothetical protein
MGKDSQALTHTATGAIYNNKQTMAEIEENVPKI